MEASAEIAAERAEGRNEVQEQLAQNDFVGAARESIEAELEVTRERVEGRMEQGREFVEGSIETGREFAEGTVDTTNELKDEVEDWISGTPGKIWGGITSK